MVPTCNLWSNVPEFYQTFIELIYIYKSTPNVIENEKDIVLSLAYKPEHISVEQWDYLGHSVSP